MALPKITQPEFEITLPVIKRKIKFRPFLVREEKVLLVGKEGAAGEQLNAMINLVEDVVLSPKNFNARDLTATDLEYLFMHLRAKSVNNIVKLKYQDKEDESVYDFEVDLNTLEPTIDPDREYTLDIGDYKVELKDPTIGIMEKVGMGLEGLDPDKIICTGSPMKEVINYYSKQISDSNILSNLNLVENNYFLFSCHREENIDDSSVIGPLSDKTHFALVCNFI